MNFGGDEIYFKQEPELRQDLWRSIITYETSTLISIRKADGTIAIRPAMDTHTNQATRFL